MEELHLKAVLKIKQFVSQYSNSSLENFIYEYITPLKSLPESLRKEKLEEVIDKYYKVLNEGYPFFAYNFKNNQFDENGFFELELMNFTFDNELNGLTDVLISIIDSTIDYNENYQKIAIIYCRAKFLEIALKEYDLIADSRINISTSNNKLNYTNEASSLNYQRDSLKWNGSQTEFIELIKALIENGNLKGTQNEIIKKMSNVFSVEINNPNKLITDIKKRNNGSETLFLDKLKKNLFNYITLEDKK